jgi:protein-disulfide isomerase
MLTRSTVILCAALLGGAGCYRQAPDKSQAERIAKLEHRVAELEALDQRLGEMTTRLQAMTSALEQLSTLDELADDMGARLGVQEPLIGPVAPAPAPVAPPPAPIRPGQPSPTAVYAVPVDGSPWLGPRYAKVTIVKAFEFACPYCERTRATMEQLLNDYGSDVRIVYKHVVVHPQVATIPARAACAADQQGAWEPMMNLIWDKGFKAGRDLSHANMEKLAGELQLDVGQLRADMQGICTQIVTDDQALMNSFGVSGTPSFFINGRYLSGARPIDQFKTVIDEELDKANQRLRRGTRLRDYYDKWVVAKGDPPIR